MDKDKLIKKIFEVHLELPITESFKIILLNEIDDLIKLGASEPQIIFLCCHYQKYPDFSYYEKMKAKILKEFLMGRKWAGQFDLTNPEQIKIWEEYTK